MSKGIFAVSRARLRAHARISSRTRANCARFVRAGQHDEDRHVWQYDEDDWIECNWNFSIIQQLIFMKEMYWVITLTQNGRSLLTLVMFYALAPYASSYAIFATVMVLVSDVANEQKYIQTLLSRELGRARTWNEPTTCELIQRCFFAFI